MGPYPALPWFPQNDELWLGILSQLHPSSPEIFFVRVIFHSNRNENRTPHLQEPVLGNAFVALSSEFWGPSDKMDHVPLFMNPFLPLTRLCRMPSQASSLFLDFGYQQEKLPLCSCWPFLWLEIGTENSLPWGEPWVWAAHLSSVLWPETMSGSKTLNSKIKKFWANWPSLSPSIGDSFMDGDKGVVVPLSLGTTGHFKEQRGNRIDCFLLVGMKNCF